MSAIIKQAIRQSPLFEHLDSRWQKRLIQAAAVHTLSRGEMIVREGNAVDALFIVLSGDVRVWSSIDERVIELETLGSGAYFGEVSLLSGKAATANVEAHSESVGVLSINRDVLLELLEEDHETRRILEDSTLKRAKDTIGKVLK